MSQLEQRANIKFMLKLETSAKETLQALQFAYGDTDLKKSAVNHQFKDGQETLEDDPCIGRPSMSQNNENVAKVKTLV
jgi:hypothetical protein